MNRRERLEATIRGEPVDRPPICFHELNGIDQNNMNADRFNIYNHPSWKRLLDLVRAKTDCIAIRGVGFYNTPENELDSLTSINEFHDERGSRCMTVTIKAGKRILTRRTRRDPDVDTVWTLEHTLKDIDDLKAWIGLPKREFGGEAGISAVMETEKALSDMGIVCIDVSDPLGEVANLFDMAEYTVIAMTEPALFHKALEKDYERKLMEIEAISKALPGRLWRIAGPEFACPPYLPTVLFREYVVRYDKPMIDIIKKYGGYPRIHAHGHINEVLDDIVSTGCTGLDPIEPPPQGNVSLASVRQKYGKQLVLFGNLEISDIEMMDTDEFRKKVISTLEEGTAGEGGGFVLMPAACPIGRVLQDKTYVNYNAIIDVMEQYYG